MTYSLRTDVERLTKQWDSGILKDCYCLVFSDVFGFKIIWNNEDGTPQSLNGNEILQGYFVVLAVYETEDEAKSHFKDFIKWVE